ncbi:putative phosphoesterase [Candidatus Endolissoclinum faulkneri L5]|uniref:Putative phosphoesterase n=1 Tax=Candidatus Endolissoclinum faulkneri L5 TaxID=1401328 RepID=V9TVL4_9PROT|nr:metallophosphoesterase [Candidatus Endolissoclinum faulkneri]AHC73728.1 putative phosphoesterase [Candidatus Endolissoclinum faulkneri L5]
MQLLAISDLHLTSRLNRLALEDLPSYPEDWLIIAGDVAEQMDIVADTLAILANHFAKVIWVAGNHELWSRPNSGEPIGANRYNALVARARALGVITPEDPFPVWPGSLPPGVNKLIIVPMFLLYDYSFRPDNVPLDIVVEWAEETYNVCSDEILLSPATYKSRIDWCHARLAQTEIRLKLEVPDNAHTILINHWPLRRDLISIPLVPRFTPWCGTLLTEDWHIRFNAYAVVTGHLHTRRTDMLGSTRFEEVSLGYPRQWNYKKGISKYLRLIIA